MNFIFKKTDLFKKTSFLIVFLFFLFFLLPKKALAVSADGSWKAAGISQSGTIKMTFKAKGGKAQGTFSGGGAGLQFGGRFSGSFSGGWNGTFSGSFSGWWSRTNAQGELENGTVGGPWSGSLSSNGSISARFDNTHAGGLSGTAYLTFSTAVFSREYGGSPSPSPAVSPSTSLTPLKSPMPSLSPSPISSSNPKQLKILGLTTGKSVEGVKATLALRNGEYKEVEVVDGRIEFDANEVRTIVVKDQEGRTLALTGESFDKGKVVMGSEKEWQDHFISELEKYARIFNNGEPVDLDKYFKINWDSDESSHKPPLFDFLRKFGFRDQINFSSDQLVKKSDIDTAAHEALGHALTEIIGEGNELEHAGFLHDNVWQPGHDERVWYNPVRWFKGKDRKLTDEEARGLAFSEGWAQYVGDKWQRKLTDSSDDESQYTVDDALQNMNNGKKGGWGEKYADESGYGAKVEGVVAAVFNHVYEGKDLEEVVADYVKVREAYKKDNDGKAPQNINEYLEQKLKIFQDEAEKDRIKELMATLELEKESSKE